MTIILITPCKCSLLHNLEGRHNLFYPHVLSCACYHLIFTGKGFASQWRLDELPKSLLLLKAREGPVLGGFFTDGFLIPVTSPVS